MESTTEAPVPLRVRLRFGRAAVQVVADEVGADVLHIKGNAADSSLRPDEASGTDVDILVRPAHVARSTARCAPVDGASTARSSTALRSVTRRPTCTTRGATSICTGGSPASAPRPRSRSSGCGPTAQAVDFAGVACRVPSIAAQATLLVLNAARGARSGADLALSWTDASLDHRAAVEELVDALDAHVAFAAATGDLERYRGERDYRLWKVVSEGGTRSEEWWARVRSAPSLGEALRIAARAPLVNVEHLSIELGRAPTRREVAAAFFARPRRMIAEAWSAVRRRGGRDDSSGPAPGVAVVEEGDAVYVARLPDGPIAVLDGVAALIWTEACAGDRETVAARVAAALEPPAEDIDRAVDEFVAGLVDRGLLRCTTD